VSRYNSDQIWGAKKTTALISVKAGRGRLTQRREGAKKRVGGFMSWAADPREFVDWHKDFFGVGGFDKGEDVIGRIG
jgi:hypothetical protein